MQDFAQLRAEIINKMEGLTTYEIAKGADLPFNSVKNFRNGQDMKLSTVEKIAQYLAQRGQE